MNTKHDTRPSTARIHADAVGMAAYKAARENGATRDEAMAEYLTAYTTTLAEG